MISVCIATYNGELFISQQLSSILSQLGEYDEVVISDDQSSDRTLEIIAGLNDPRVKLFSIQPSFSLELIGKRKPPDNVRGNSR